MRVPASEKVMMPCDESRPKSRAPLAGPPPCSAAPAPSHHGPQPRPGPLGADRRSGPGSARRAEPGRATRALEPAAAAGRSTGRPAGSPRLGVAFGTQGQGWGPRLRGVADGVHNHVVLLQRGRAVLLHHRLLQHLADRERLVAQPARRTPSVRAPGW